MTVPFQWERSPPDCAKGREAGADLCAVIALTPRRPTASDRALSGSWTGPRRRQELSSDQAHLSAEQDQPQANPRISCSHGDQKRPQGDRASPRPGTQASLGRLRRQVIRNAAPMPSESYSARFRVRRRPEFLSVQRRGHKFHLRHFLVFACMDEDASTPPRIGITVTKKIGNAVVRNGIKRRVREVFRRNKDRVPAGLSMVWVAKRQAQGIAHGAVLDDFESLLSRPDFPPTLRAVASSTPSVHTQGAMKAGPSRGEGGATP